MRMCGVTLLATTGDGLPDFSTNFTIPPAFKGDCGIPSMDCAVETTILSHCRSAELPAPGAPQSPG